MNSNANDPNLKQALREICFRDDGYRLAIFRESARFMASEQVCQLYDLIKDIPIKDFGYLTPLCQRLGLVPYETSGRDFRKLNQDEGYGNNVLFQSLTPTQTSFLLKLDYIDGGPIFRVFSNEKWMNHNIMMRGEVFYEPTIHERQQAAQALRGGICTF